MATATVTATVRRRTLRRSSLDDYGRSGSIGASGYIPISIWRGLVCLGTAALIIGSATSALTGVFRARNPKIALMVSPDDPVALVNDVDQSLKEGGEEFKDFRALRRSAERSLAGVIVNPGALRLIALDSEAQGDKRRAAKLLDLAEQLTRRDVRTQLWLVEKSVESRDVRGALAHYDRMLRTAVGTRPLLFPIFDRAGSEPAAAQEIVKLLQSEPPWLGTFLDWVVVEAPTVDNLGKIFRSVRPRSAEIWTEARKRALIIKFVNAGDNDTAFELYRLYGGEQTGTGLRNGRFVSIPRFPPIDWAAGNDSDVAVSLPASSEGGVEYVAASGKSGAVVSQLVALGIGRYRLAVTMTHNQDRRGISPRWSVNCVGGRTGEVGFIATPAGPNRLQKMQTTFTISDPECRYQLVRLDIRPADTGSEQRGKVIAVGIDRLP